MRALRLAVDSMSARTPREWAEEIVSTWLISIEDTLPSSARTLLVDRIATALTRAEGLAGRMRAAEEWLESLEHFCKGHEGCERDGGHNALSAVLRRIQSAAWRAQ